MSLIDRLLGNPEQVYEQYESTKKAYRVARRNYRAMLIEHDGMDPATVDAALAHMDLKL